VYILVAGLIEDAGAKLNFLNADNWVLSKDLGTKSIFLLLAISRAVKSMRVVAIPCLSSLEQVLIIIRYKHHFIWKMQVLSVNNVEDD